MEDTAEYETYHGPFTALNNPNEENLKSIEHILGFASFQILLHSKEIAKWCFKKDEQGKAKGPPLQGFNQESIKKELSWPSRETIRLHTKFVKDAGAASDNSDMEREEEYQQILQESEKLREKQWNYIAEEDDLRKRINKIIREKSVRRRKREIVRLTENLKKLARSHRVCAREIGDLRSKRCKIMEKMQKKNLRTLKDLSSSSESSSEESDGLTCPSSVEEVDKNEDKLDYEPSGDLEVQME